MVPFTVANVHNLGYSGTVRWQHRMHFSYVLGVSIIISHFGGAILNLQTTFQVFKEEVVVRSYGW